MVSDLNDRQQDARLSSPQYSPLLYDLFVSAHERFCKTGGCLSLWYATLGCSESIDNPWSLTDKIPLALSHDGLAHA